MPWSGRCWCRCWLMSWRWTGEAGDAAGARDQFAALVPVRERVSGPEHPDTLTDRANLARWIRLAQNP